MTAQFCFYPAARSRAGGLTGTAVLILLFYAFAREIAPLARRIKPRRAIDDPFLRGFRAQLGATEIVAIATGMGFARAQRAARRALDLFPAAEIVIGTGVAGALSSGLGEGDLILADRIVATRGGASDHIATIDSATLDELGGYLRLAGIGYSTGAILTSHRVLGTGAEKRAANQVTGAIAVDMETAALAIEARERGLRFAALRAVMDTVDDDVVGAEMADENGAVRPLTAANFLMRNPSVMIRLPRMMRSLGRATRSIAAALEAIASRGAAPATRRRRG
jgi:nucleoside phosphorylase